MRAPRLGFNTVAPGVGGPLEVFGLGDGFTLTLASDLAEISRLTERLARFGRDHDLPDRAIQHMTLALDELITNVVEHGTPDGAPDAANAEPTVNVHLWLEPGWLHAELVDAGHAARVRYESFSSRPTWTTARSAASACISSAP